MAVFRIERTRDLYCDEQSSFTKCKPVVKSQGAAFHDAVFARGLELHHPWSCKDL